MGCLAAGAHLGTWMIFRDELGQAHKVLSASGEETQHLHYRVRGGEDGRLKEAEEEERERQGRSGRREEFSWKPMEDRAQGGGAIYCAHCSVG